MLRLEVMSAANSSDREHGQGQASAVNHDAAWAAPFRSALAHAPRAIRVLSPCVGLNSPARAAAEMGMPWESSGDWDTNGALAEVARMFCGDGHRLHIGRLRGDVCSVPLEELDKTADAIISGPPCPPYSTMGKRLLECDPRASVFTAILQWISFLSKHGRLQFFILENVPGIMRKRRADQESFADWVMSGLRETLPQDWEVDLRTHNSLQCMLPQSRPRVFFVGWGPAMRQTRFQKRVLSQPYFAWPQVELLSFLDHEPADGDWEQLSTRQKVNALEYLRQFQGRVAESGWRRTVAIADVARDPMLSFDTVFSIGYMRTLRTNCSHLWLLPSEDLQSSFGPRGRFLSRSEKCRAAGIVASSVVSLSDTQLCTALGNTIPVPLIGIVSFPLFRAWIVAAGA